MARRLSSSYTYPYLGLEVGAHWSSTSPVEEVLLNGLAEINAAPLKPWQRMSVLEDSLNPKVMHGLTLGGARQRFLCRLDIAICKCVTSWMKLPQHTSILLIHTVIRGGGGGLGVLEFRQVVPLYSQALLRKFEASTKQESLVSVVVEHKLYVSMSEAINRPVVVGHPHC